MWLCHLGLPSAATWMVTEINFVYIPKLKGPQSAALFNKMV